MAVKYLLDTNIIIYLLDGKVPFTALSFMRAVIQQPIVSVITEVETRGFAMPVASEQLFESFFNTAKVLELNRAVVDRTILLRKTYKIKTPDAIIAATALE
jgi:predicted nucleic acid-binding protein